MRVLLVCFAVTLAVGCSAPASPPVVEDAGTGGRDAGPGDAGANEPDAGQPDAGTDADAGEPDAGADAGAGLDAGLWDGGVDPLIRARPYAVTVPAAADGGTALPLVLLLHGYGADAASQDLYLGFSTLARQRGFLLALPNGTFNAQAQRFWNATNACCGFGAAVDDVAYLTAVIDDMARRFRVDPRRVYLVGHSNGGFMSFRMACDRANKVTAVASLAGAAWKDQTRCVPSQPVSVLEMHGTFDSVILYGGGANAGVEYPGAVETVATWGALNGCQAGTSTAMPDQDYVFDALGAETTRTRHDGCPPTGAAELWSMSGAPHAPSFNSSWAGAVYDWLQAHARP